MFRRTLVILPLLALSFAAGCETRIGYLNAISTKNVYADHVDLTKLPKTENVTAQKVTFLGFGANLQDPLDEALTKGKGNMMLDAVVYVKDYWLFFGYKVRGTVVNVPTQQPPVAAQPTAPAK